ncbi:MAG TPA: polysaccharide deacetylase family protein [Chloroflexi bacterium]|nr:polysaccharide deacetylase family protein [Chloroflexota bacterium]
MQTKTLTTILVILILLAACGQSDDASPPVPPEETAVPEAETPLLTWEQLKNAAYTLPMEMGGPEDGRIPLENGEFSVAAAPGSASMNRFFLYPGVAYGDLDGDGREDALVILINNSAGSGNFYHLIPVRNSDGQPQPLNAAFIGDRVIIEQLRVADGQAQLLFRTYRPEETFGSTPTLQVDRRYVLQGDVLELLSEETLNANELVNDTETEPVIPIELPETGGAVSYTGQTGPFALDRYTVFLTAGQEVSVTLTAAHQDAFLSIFGLETGDVLLRVREEQASWQGVIPETQEYAVNVFAVGAETEYTLTIEAGESDTAVPPPPPVKPEGVGNAVYLTFDDGPLSPYTGQILDLLAQYNARATFFIIGVNAQASPEQLQAIEQGGHTLANHTWNHESLAGMSQAAFNQTVLQAEQAIGPAAAPCLRPPYGATDAFTRAYAAELGYEIVMWNIDTLDWSQPGVEAIVASVTDNVYPGAIVLMHDGGGNRAQTVAALEIILSNLSSQGYALEALCQ